MFSRQTFRLCSQSLRKMTTTGDSSGAKLVTTGERSVNHVTLLGRCGRGAELRGSEEHPVALFPLATSVSIKKPDGSYEQITQWHKIAVFRPGLREMVASTIVQGDRVYIIGTLNYSTYVDDGQTKNSTSIIASEIINLTNKKNTSSTQSDDGAATTS